MWPSPTSLPSPAALLLLAATATALLALNAWLRRARRRRLRNKHVWVIGASRGLGRSVARRLAAEGVLVSVSSRESPALRELHAELKSHAGVCVPLDLCRADFAKLDAAFRVVDSRAPVDVVLCNAAVNHDNRSFGALLPDEIDAVINTNLRAVLRIASACLPALRTRRGTLAIVSSLSAYRGVPGASVYGATKAALTTFCQSLAVEYLGQMDVVCIHPGFISTDAIKHLDHPKPFVMSPDRAADYVIDALAARAAHVAFPWVMEHIVLRFSRALPTPIYTWLLYHAT